MNRKKSQFSLLFFLLCELHTPVTRCLADTQTSFDFAEKDCSTVSPLWRPSPLPLLSPWRHSSARHAFRVSGSLDINRYTHTSLSISPLPFTYSIPFHHHHHITISRHHDNPNSRSPLTLPYIPGQRRGTIR